MGVILASGTIFAYSYYANDIGYIKQGLEDEISVSAALNDLYSKVPSGTTTIEANGTYDVSEFATAIVQNLYTATQYNNNYTEGYNAGRTSSTAGKNVCWDKGSFTVENGAWSVNCGFVPKTIFIWTISCNNNWVHREMYQEESGWIQWSKEPNGTFHDYTSTIQGAYQITSNGFASGTGWGSENGAVHGYVALSE